MLLLSEKCCKLTKLENVCEKSIVLTVLLLDSKSKASRDYINGSRRAKSDCWNTVFVIVSRARLRFRCLSCEKRIGKLVVLLDWLKKLIIRAIS